jgi:hypothetical protein
MPDQPANLPYVDAPVLPACVAVDHWDEPAARARLALLDGELPVRVPAEARWCPGASNDAWDLGETFLRVCWRADRDRVAREAALLAALPAEVPHAPVYAHGRTAQLSWLLTGRVPGRPLADGFEAADSVQKRRLAHQAADILTCLHEWTPPAQLRCLLADRPHCTDADPLSVWAADLLPLPVARVPAHLRLARQLPHVDPGLVHAVGERIGSLADADPFGVATPTPRVVHSDPSLGNWFVHDGRISALLDFEWARLGPPDLELVTPVFTAAHGDAAAQAFLSRLADDYPAMFAAPDLDRRLWLYELCFFLRGIIWWPPNAPEPRLDPGHHVHTLRRLLDGPLPR